MVIVSYFDGIRRAGMLAWRETPEGPLQALGGFDVSPISHMRGLEAAALATAGDQPNPLTTVVSTDAGERTLRGWIHPDRIREVNGIADGEDVRERP